MAIDAILKSVYTLAKAIHGQVELAKANKSQCKTLAQRIDIVVAAVRKLENITNSDHYLPALINLQSTLQQCSDFVVNFSKDQSWFKQVLKAGTADKRFAELNTDLQKSSNLLNLGLSAQQIINREQDQKDRQDDYKQIQEQQETIIRLNQKASEQLSDIKLQESEHHAIMVQQLASMRGRIIALNVNQNPPKPLIHKHLTALYYELEFRQKLAQGSLGTVYLGRWREQIVAIKTLGADYKADDLTQLTREIAIMSRLPNKHVVQLYGACVEAERPCLVMEYLEKGSLYKVLGEEKLIPEQQHRIVLSVARGLHYLHTQEVFHRDLKSANVLLNEHYEAKLADFGLSKIKTMSIVPTHEKSISVAWQAPECLQAGTTYTLQSDVYSFGVIVWEIMTGKRPYADCRSDRDVAARVLAKKFEVIPKDIPEIYQDIIRRCWEPDPLRRPSLVEVIRNLEKYKPEAEKSAEDYYQLGIASEKQGKLKEARQAYERSVNLGHVKACTNLGVFALKGSGGPQDKKQAFQLFSQAADEGHLRAMMNAAAMLENGDGVPKDLDKAVSLYDKASSQDPGAATKSQKIKSFISESRKENSSAAAAPSQLSAADEKAHGFN